MFSNIFKVFFLLIFGLATQWRLIRWLKTQKAYQPIYELSPGSHQKKAKTPSFGGIGILLTFLMGVLLWVPISVQTSWCVAMIIAAALI